MKITKLIGVLGLGVGTILTTSGCSQSKGIEIWTFSDELMDIVDTYYGGNASVIIKTSVTQIRSDLINAVESGRGVPDVIALEAAVVADFTTDTAEKSYLLPLDDIGGTDDMYEYTKSVATSTDGKILGLSWQATPGGFFYKKSVASKLGINSVEAMQEKLSTWDGYLALAAQAKEQRIALCSSITDPVKVFLSAREKSWIGDNGKLSMEEVMFGGGEKDNCFDVVRALQQNNYTHEAADRGPRWVSDIDSANTLGYFCSSWGLNFDLMPNAKTTKGDWQMCKAPVDYFKGGTWLAIPKGSQKVEEAKEFVKFVTTDKTFLKQRGKSTGDFMNSKSVMSELVQDYQCEFLGGQNHLALLYDVAENINGDLISPYDATLDSLYTTTVANFARDEASTPSEVEIAREEHKTNFIDAVRAKYKTLVE